MSGWLMVVNPTVRVWAQRALQWELVELARRLAPARARLEADRARFEQLYARLADMQAPLLKALATRNAEISRLGGRVPRADCGVLHPAFLEDQRQMTRHENAKRFYRLIVAHLHHQGDYIDPARLQAARQAYRQGQVLRLLELYQQLCGQDSASGLTPYNDIALSPTASDADDPLIRDLRHLLFQRLLLDSIEQEQQRLNADPLLSAWNAGRFEDLLHECEDELRVMIRARDEQIALLQLEIDGFGGSPHVHITH